jgi:hypothetical protein
MSSIAFDRRGFFLVSPTTRETALRVEKKRSREKMRYSTIVSSSLFGNLEQKRKIGPLLRRNPHSTILDPLLFTGLEFLFPVFSV